MSSKNNSKAGKQEHQEETQEHSLEILEPEQSISLEQAKAQLYRAGIQLTPQDYKNIREAKNQAQNSGGWLGKVSAFTPVILDALTNITNIILAFAQRLIQALGLPLILILLLIVEVERVSHGIGIFEASYESAHRLAIALVVANFAIEIAIHHIEVTSGFHQSKLYRFSLRGLWRGFLQFAGWSRDEQGADNWSPQEKSPASRWIAVRKSLTFAILLLALTGSMAPTISATSGAWYQALGSIVAESNLTNFVSWLNGLVVAFVAVTTAQALTAYLSTRVFEMLKEQEILKQEAEAFEIAYILNKLRRYEQSIKAEQGSQIGSLQSPAELQDELEASPINFTQEPQGA